MSMMCVMPAWATFDIVSVTQIPPPTAILPVTQVISMMKSSLVCKICVAQLSKRYYRPLASF
jgi:hypothetical protein